MINSLWIYFMGVFIKPYPTIVAVARHICDGDSWCSFSFSSYRISCKWFNPFKATFLFFFWVFLLIQIIDQTYKPYLVTVLMVHNGSNWYNAIESFLYGFLNPNEIISHSLVILINLNLLSTNWRCLVRELVNHMFLETLASLWIKIPLPVFHPSFNCLWCHSAHSRPHFWKLKLSHGAKGWVHEMLWRGFVPSTWGKGALKHTTDYLAECIASIWYGELTLAV